MRPKTANRLANERRTGVGYPERSLFDEHMPPDEQLPRRFRIKFTEVSDGTRPKVVLSWDGKTIGDELTDNSYIDDGYRFHDVFHLGFAALLGWSPMSRKLFGCKRRSDPTIDEVEDGGRARIIEEAVCALVYDYARKRDFLAGADRIEPEILETIKSLTRDREVKARSTNDWSRAILDMYDVWRKMWENRGGWFEADLNEKHIAFSPEGTDRTGEIAGA